MAGAERSLAPLSLLGLQGDPEVLNMLGAIRLSQGRLTEAVALLSQGRTAAPRESHSARWSHHRSSFEQFFVERDLRPHQARPRKIPRDNFATARTHL